MRRRDVIKGLAVAGGAAAVGCRDTRDAGQAKAQARAMTTKTESTVNPILGAGPLPPGVSPWRTQDPFLFCVHHADDYPRADGNFGPAASLEGRDMGQDFAGKDGWRMYHGQSVPGFPQHPHRGFETVTLARKGFIDHSDSLGAVARFGEGDVQWLTAGGGINHSEMFPLLDTEKDNPAELFQIWLNLPAKSKMVKAYFSMFWNQDIPRVKATDASGKQTEVTVIAGRLGDATPHAPPPDSWASEPGSEVAIWAIRMEPGASWTLPAGVEGLNRSLYFFRGSELTAAGRKIPARHQLDLRSDVDLSLVAGAEPIELLMLQGRPIKEPVVQYGPFVMNSREEIQQTLFDYQRTQFGGWKWDRPDPVHGKEPEHFARHPDGRIERPKQA